MSVPVLHDFTFTSVTVAPDGRIVEWPAGTGRYFPEDLGSLDLDMVAVPGGTFLMGSPEDEVGRSPAEGPRHTVGMYPANAFGLHDMHGNLFEWCEDILHTDLAGAPDDGTPWLEGPGSWPDYHVLRGASWVNPPVACRSAFRTGNSPIYKSIAIGFRVVCEAA
jgi:formylglycine-generating enzyme required for sulfatase activity